MKQVQLLFRDAGHSYTYKISEVIFITFCKDYSNRCFKTDVGAKLYKCFIKINNPYMCAMQVYRSFFRKFFHQS
jgi:hypothetical protein